MVIGKIVNKFEACLVEITVDSFQFALVGIYRSHNPNVNKFLDKLDIVLDTLAGKYKNIIIAGDININVLDVSHEHRILVDTLYGHNFKYLIDFPTRITEYSETAIDNLKAAGR